MMVRDLSVRAQPIHLLLRLGHYLLLTHSCHRKPSQQTGQRYSTRSSHFSLETPLRQTKQDTTIYAHLQSPFSRGSVGIASKSWADKPLVNLNFYSDPAHVEMALVALKRICEDIYGSPSVQPLLDGGEDLVFFLRNKTASLFDATGTTNMGQASDPLAVLDTQARVFGVQGLRVVELGAVPLLLPAAPAKAWYSCWRRKLPTISRMASFPARAKRQQSRVYAI